MEKSAYEVKAGDKFSYQGIKYRATKNATGEFNAYIKVYDDNTGADSEIVIPHSSIVLLEA